MIKKLFKNKVAITYFFLLIVLSIFMVRSGIGINKVPYPGDATTIFFPSMYVTREAFISGTVPLWNPYIMGGTLLHASGQSQVFSLLSVLTVIISSPYLAMTINNFIHLLILGLGMYFFAKTVGLEKKYAVISSLIVLVSGYVGIRIFFAFFHLMGFAYFPWVLAFCIMGLKSKKWLLYAVLAGVFVSLEMFSGALEIFIFSWWAVIYVMCYNVFGKNFKGRAIKSASFFIIFAIVCVGLVSIKLLPGIEFAKISNRQIDYDFETAVGAHVNTQNVFFMLVDDRNLFNLLEHRVKGSSSCSPGIMALLLAIFSLPYIKKKRYIFLLGFLVFSLFMVTKSPWNFLLYNFFPFFKNQKHVDKAIFVYLTLIAILAAYGLRNIISKIKDTKISKYVYIGAIVLIILTSWGATYDMMLKDAMPELESVDIMKYMAQDDGYFRFKSWETNGIDWGTNYYSVLYGLEDIYGLLSLWHLDYLPRFLSVANNQPAKIFGILNMKYMTSREELNISGFELVRVFDDNVKDCEYNEGNIVDFRGQIQCPAYEVLKKAWGPYLYENKKFLPRAYFVKNSVLVVGDDEAKTQTIYALTLDDRFDPSNTVIIKGRGMVNDYSAEELKKYSAILLTQGSIDQSSSFVLKEYVDNGGILLPNIVEGETGIGEKEIGEMWGEFEGELNAIDDNDYIKHNLNKYEAVLNKGQNNGFLVVSEKFSLFPGWKVTGDGEKLGIERVDGVISAVYLDKQYGKILFEYKPDEYVLGKNISIVTLLIVVMFFGYHIYNEIISKKKKDLSKSE